MVSKNVKKSKNFFQSIQRCVAEFGICLIVTGSDGWHKPVYLHKNLTLKLGSCEKYYQSYVDVSKLYVAATECALKR